MACGSASSSGGVAATGASSTASAQADKVPELVLVGGDIRTMDSAVPHATAVAVGGGVIQAVGSDQQVRALAGPNTRVVQLHGATVTPGLVDGHSHLYGLGSSLETVSLKGLTSESEAAAVVATAAQKRPAGEWITGRGWDQTRWTPRAFPTFASLDKLVPDHPVAVRRVDGHALWANSAAMKVAGITKETPDPEGGRLERDDTGAPTGVFVDEAISLIEQHVPAPTAEVRERRIVLAAQRAVAVGLTGIHEMGIGDETIAVYRKLAAQGRLPLRVYGFLAYDEHTLAGLPTRERIIDQGAGRFTLRAVKLFADGALGSRGAALFAPYTDDPGNTGLIIVDEPELERAAVVAAEHGWQVGVHAIGDRGNGNVLNAYAHAQRLYPDRDLRFRVEHAQVLAPIDIPRFAELGVIASMQPTHCTSDMRWAEARLGPERIVGAYAWRSLLATGAHIVAGSDFPIEDVSPLLGIYAAVTRQDLQGNPEGGWYPEQKLTLDEAIRIFTVEPAFGSFSEQRRGRIAVGLDADLTVFDRPLTAGPALLEIRVQLTIVGGEIVFSKD